MKIILGVIIGLLCIPLIAMQFTEEVNWSLFDFAVMAILLSLTGFSIEIAIRKTQNLDRRYFYITLIVLVFLLVWAQLAVGITDLVFGGS
jgi:hypothetical protein